MEMADLHKVWEIKALKKPGEDEARRILEHVAKQVQPIMRRRKWRVKLLSEFCPANSALLGLNVGKGIHVKLRLRRPGGNPDFFSYEEVLDTMLHELCHIEHGPHNALFYKLWDDIRKECEELIAKGIMGSGQGFDALGRRLGGFSHQPSLSSLRATALAAAERRKLNDNSLPSGPKRLGGDSNIMASLTPVQAAAMAAERRIHDDLWCASESDVLDDDDVDNCHFKRSVELSNISSTSGKDLSGAVSKRQKGDVETRERIGKRIGSSFSVGSASGDDFGPISDPPLDFNPVSGTDERMIWECGVCTLFNKPLALACEACGSERPKNGEEGSKTWSCRRCTLDNSVKIERCSACEEWRYSLGAPASSGGPNSAT